MKSIATFILPVILFAACSDSNTQISSYSEHESAFYSKQEVKYAKGFDICSYKNYKIITVFDPWNSPDTLASYCITNDKNIRFSGCDFQIVIPLNRVACLSSTSVAMMNLINEGKKITACSDAKLIYDSALYKRFLDGKVADLGNTHLVNAEVVINHSPDIVMKYIWHKRNGG